MTINSTNIPVTTTDTTICAHLLKVSPVLKQAWCERKQLQVVNVQNANKISVSSQEYVSVGS
jgi:hypothetical protein